jgi:hypothetical protein
MTCAEFEGDLTPVAVAAHQGANEAKRRDQRVDIVGELGIRELSVRIRRASMSATIRRDDTEVLDEVRQHRVPHGA